MTKLIPSDNLTQADGGDCDHDGPNGWCLMHGSPYYLCAYIVGQITRRLEAEGRQAKEVTVAYGMARADRPLDTVALLQAALLALRNRDRADGPCWCRYYFPRRHQNHSDVCLQARVALD